MIKDLAQIFHNGADLKLFKVRIYIDEETAKKLNLKENYIEIINEWVLDHEVLYKRNDVKIIGYISIRDTIDLTAKIDLNKAKIQIYMIDIYENHCSRMFNITNFKEEADTTKLINIKLQDDISYILENTYLSKSFNGKSRVSAIKEYFNELKITNLITSRKLKMELEDDGDTSAFTIGRDDNALNVFQKLLKNVGFIMYQDREGLKIKKRDNLLPGKLETEKDIYKDAEFNNYYKNKIFDSEVILMDKEKANQIGKQKSLYFDYKTKSMKEYSDKEYLGQTSINKDGRDFRDTVGTKIHYQNKVDESGYKADVQEELLKMSQMIISVVGLIDRNINKVIQIEMLGNKSYVDGYMEGNVPTSGKYLVFSIIDKYLNGKYIQLLRLYRSDNQKF